jgi:DNA-binding GntR family transcriptional regulator
MKFTPYGLDTSRHASTPQRGVLVPVLTDQDLADVLLARDALESAAIRQIIAQGLMETAYEALDKCVTEMETAAAAGDWAAVGTLDLEFHTALVAAAGSTRLQRMFTTVISSEMPVCLGMVSATRSRSRADSVARHRRMAHAVREGDAGPYT